MLHQLGWRSGTRPGIVVLLVLAGLLSSFAASAEVGGLGGAGVGVMAESAMGTIKSATGSFDSVDASLTETDSGGTADSFTLQLYTNPLPRPAVCGNDSTINPDCKGLQQFIFSSDGQYLNACNGQPCAFIAYWLHEFGTTCPSGWTQVPTTAHCIQRSQLATFPGPFTVNDLANMSLKAEAVAGGDDKITIIRTVGGSPQILGSATAPDNTLYLASNWKRAGFNIFGGTRRSTANFSNNGAITNPTIVVRTSIDDGSQTRPNCVEDSWTLEKNNLFPGTSAPAAVYQGSPALVSSEYLGGSSNMIPFCSAAIAVGDTHLTTFAGTHYDFQASGDFLLAQVGSDFVVQTRQVSGAPNWPDASINKAVATKIGSTRVAVCVAPTRLVVDGKPTNLPDGKTLSLPGGVTVSRNGSVYFIKGQNGDGVVATLNHRTSPSNDWIDVTVGLGDGSRAARVRGLLGSPDGNVDGIVTRDGTVLRVPVSFEDLYHSYADSWRVPRNESLLCNDNVVSGIPARPFYANDLNPQQHQQARAICTAAGVKEGAALEDCTLDVAVLGDKTAANVFVHARAPVIIIKPTADAMKQKR